MIVGLVGNSEAAEQAFTASTSEHLSWREIIEVYQAVVPLMITPRPIREFGFSGGKAYQVRFDRMLDRRVDNSKILTTSGVGREDVTSIREGLQHKLREFLMCPRFGRVSVGEDARLDAVLGGLESAVAVRAQKGRSTAFASVPKYFVRRFWPRARPSAAGFGG